MYTLLLRYYKPVSKEDIDGTEYGRVGHVSLELRSNTDGKKTLISFCDKVEGSVGFFERLLGVPAQLIAGEPSKFGDNMGRKKLTAFRSSYGSSEGFVASVWNGLSRLLKSPKNAFESEEAREGAAYQGEPSDYTLAYGLSSEFGKKIIKKFNNLDQATKDKSLRWGLLPMHHFPGVSYRNATCESIVEEVLSECVPEVWGKMVRFSHTFPLERVTPYQGGLFMLGLGCWAVTTTIVSDCVHFLLPFVLMASFNPNELAPGIKPCYLLSVAALWLMCTYDRNKDIDNVKTILDAEGIRGVNRILPCAAVDLINFTGTFFGIKNGARAFFGNSPEALGEIVETAQKTCQLPHYYK